MVPADSQAYVMPGGPNSFPSTSGAQLSLGIVEDDVTGTTEMATALTIPEKIPRPPNAFILYRRSKQVEISRGVGISRTPNKDVSRIAGEMWQREPDHVKDEFKRQAEEAKQSHMSRYPNYKYTPKVG